MNKIMSEMNAVMNILHSKGKMVKYKSHERIGAKCECAFSTLSSVYNTISITLFFLVKNKGK